jgi:adenine-specific DNA-methyltransferase
MKNRLVQNTESNGRFHTDWLNMIYPRLKVAKDLLTKDGAIFISIDDNEQANLKKVCDEVFGGDNFVAQMIWEQGRKSAGKTIAINHEYCLIYCKSLLSVLQLVNLGKQFWKTKKKGLDILYNKEFELRRKYGNDLISINKEYKSFLSQLSENSPAYMHKHYKCIDEKGIYFPADASAPDSPETRCHKALIHPITKKECKVPKLGWRYNETTLMQLYNNSQFHFGVDETVIPCIKRYLKDTEYEVASSVFYKDGRGASNRLATLMGKKVFDFPKDEFIIEDFIKLVSTDNKDDIILDFFSGSATTAHAVMQLNAEDGGNRKFIMVQLSEKTDEKSEAYKAGYKNICEIGKERIRRAGKKIKEENAGKEGIDKLDTGFRVLKLDSSNMLDVYYTPKDFTEQDLFADNVKPDRTAEDLLFQVMLDLGVELSATIEQRAIDGKRVFFVNDNYLVACFDENIAESTITEIAKMKPYYFVMRDSSLASDNVADNFDQLFETYSKDTIRKII